MLFPYKHSISQINQAPKERSTPILSWGGRGSEVCLHLRNAHDHHHGGHSCWCGFKAVMGERFAACCGRNVCLLGLQVSVYFLGLVFILLAFLYKDLKWVLRAPQGSMRLRSVNKAMEFTTARGSAGFGCGSGAICTSVPSPAMRRG